MVGKLYPALSLLLLNACAPLQQISADRKQGYCAPNIGNGRADDNYPAAGSSCRP
jgi:hypothetical protein